jgi:hypothetical protein
MSGGIGYCRDPACWQTGMPEEDAFCTDACHSAPEPAASTGARP